jgi:hypothetical protein
MNTKHGAKATTKNTGKGKAAGKGKRVAKAVPAPEAVVEDVAEEAIVDDAPVTEAEAPAIDETPADADVPVEEAGATGEAAPKRKRDMSIDDLRAEYLRVIGRETGSTDRRYLLWKISEAGKGKITVGPVEKRAPRAKEDIQVLPIGMLRTTVAALDAAVANLEYKNRSMLIRDALVAFLRAEESDVAKVAADRIEAEGF